MTVQPRRMGRSTVDQGDVLLHKLCMLLKTIRNNCLGGKEGNHGWAQCVSPRLYPHLALEPSDVNLTNLCASVLSAASYQILRP